MKTPKLRQPIKNEYHTGGKTPEDPQRREDPSQFYDKLGSSYPIFLHGVFHPSPSPVHFKLLFFLADEFGPQVLENFGFEKFTEEQYYLNSPHYRPVSIPIK